jgi:hypothetical protein
MTERNKAIKTDFRNKAITSTTPVESVEHQVRFEPGRFNSLIFDKGYDVFIDKAIKCPCTVKGSGQALLTCNNCIGLGWLFINRTETRVVMQQLKADFKFENWSQTTAGMSKITARAVDKLSFMDRIILREVEGFFSEVVLVRNFNEEKVVFPLYEPLEIESLFLFVGDKSPLKPIYEKDYKIDGYKIILSDKFDSIENMSVSIRYRHLLSYHIIDMNRDIMKVRSKNCTLPNEQLTDMPISGMARKAHYIFDNIKYEGEGRVIENNY